MQLQLLAALLISLFSLALSIPLSTSDSDITAPIVYDNPQGVLFEGSLFDKKNTTLRGWITAWAPPSGVGVKIHADFWGFPEKGPFRMFPLSSIPPDISG